MNENHHGWPDHLPLPISRHCGRYYDGNHRSIAHGIKDKDPASINQAAREMAERIQRYPKTRTELVPIPAHTGRADATLHLAREIAKIRGFQLTNILRMEPQVTSRYQAKKTSGQMREISMDIDGPRPGGNRRVILIDNTIDTGATLFAAMKELPHADVLSHSVSDHWERRLEHQRATYYGHTIEHQEIDRALRVGTLFFQQKRHVDTQWQKLHTADGTPLLCEFGSREYGAFSLMQVQRYTHRGLETIAQLAYQVENDTLRFEDFEGSNAAIQVQSEFQRKGIATQMVELALSTSQAYRIQAPAQQLTSASLNGLLQSLSERVQVVSYGDAQHKDIETGISR
jgi:hypoxanthine-guanine phosphoribosyltransferase